MTARSNDPDDPIVVTYRYRKSHGGYTIVRSYQSAPAARRLFEKMRKRDAIEYTDITMRGDPSPLDSWERKEES